MKKILSGLAIGVLTLGAAVTGSANLITNGDFETGTLTGWNVDGDVVIGLAINYTSQLPGMSNYFALLGQTYDTGNSQISQKVDLTGINNITISFDYAFNYYDKSNQNDVLLSLLNLNNQTTPAIKITMLDLTSFGSDNDEQTGIISGHYECIYDISSYTLNNPKAIFRLAEHTPIAGIVQSMAGIDNVQLTSTPVPEPGSLLLMGTGLAGLVAVGRRRLGNKA